MEQEFTTSTFFKILYGFLAIILIGFAIFFFNNGTGKAGPALFIFPVVMLALAVVIIINLYKRKVVVSDYGVAYTSVWGTKELVKTDIKGFRIGDKATVIEPAADGYSKITIRDFSSIGNSKDLIALLGYSYSDLNKIEYDEQKELLLQDEELGRTAEDRAGKLKTLSRYTTIFSTVGFVMFFVILYLRLNHPLLPVFLLIYPLIGILLFGFGKGVIRLFSKKNSPYPAVGIGTVFSVIALVFQAMINDQVLDYHNFWTPFFVIGIMVLVLLCAMIFKRPAAKTGELIFALLIAVGYGWGGTLQVNCGFDNASPQVYKATVLTHHISHGKTTSYHILLSEWGQHNQTESVTVSQSFYENAPLNSQVNVNLKKGVLNIPWYYLTL
ncbi:hypothetical protein [Mucilaginibacter sp.]|uniref:hypothetical protein n=1 Tax=Mucilaginibacter sp. TaxID=1882438 RepID=UPI0025D8CB5B|nr:hypothetical protein [Mucilaginibacter sp.]